MNLEGQTALVTGATRGIGLAVAEALVKSGARVAGTGRSAADLARVRKALGPGFEGRVLDLASPRSLDACLEWAERERLDILVNNAGVNKIADVRRMAFPDWDAIIAVNLTAAAKLSQAAARSMARRRYGRILQVSSVFGLVSRAQRAAYSASKAGLLGLTRAMALDLAPAGILVNALCPGFTDTELTRRILSAAERRALARSVPLGRMAAPAEIAAAALFLVSSENSYVTGQCLAVDGGFTAQ